jgi:hypothetical protein
VSRWLIHSASSHTEKLLSETLKFPSEHVNYELSQLMYEIILPILHIYLKLI